MTARHDATQNQVDAARPDASTWLSANAGSGKTRVLTDRVARLLLDGVDPQNILCLTYTKAAASEMQNRLFQRLGEWAMMGDTALTQALSTLGASPGHNLRQARTLFAAAIETPGGLKIQTIHSFCAGLLRRFPLEAGVSPQFKEIDDRSADLLRAEVIEQMADGDGAAQVAALARLVTDEDFSKLTKSITALGHRFGPVELADALQALGHPAELDPHKIADVLGPGDLEMLLSVVKTMGEAKTKEDPKAVLRLGDITPLDILGRFDRLSAFFLTQDGTARKRLPTGKVRGAHSAEMDQFDALKHRVANAHDHMLSVKAAQAAVTINSFGVHYAQAYAQAKAARGWLDFDDLITKAQALLTDPKVAAWVLYRLDGGIDHILVDEAQDTSPAQWDVVRQLAAEFGTGEGARDTERTIFVVGDKKQSIYSFQGADPREFDRMQSEFSDRLLGAGAQFQSRELAYSFRSSPAILRLVDQVFDRVDTVDSNHKAFKTELPGRVDLWPICEPVKKPEKQEFTASVDSVAPSHHDVTLANQIAKRISAMLANKETIPDEQNGQIIRREIQPRDILILVQSRSGIFPQLIRALKQAKLPIAGTDRLKVSAELAVKDLGALLAFLSTQDDDLALATALRSPLFGWSEQALFSLAHHRPAGSSLWEALRKQGGEVVDILHDLRANTDFLRPYDLIERILNHHGGRHALLSRLGPEAADGIDALLDQALNYERTDVPSLTGFLAWMQTDDLEIKRQVDSASNQIRVMTVHGSKGLEAPIVILPDCTATKVELRDKIIEHDGILMWRPNQDALPDQLQQTIESLKNTMWEEKLRLLYVALTRAEKWLIIAGAGALPKDGPSWYQLVEQAMAHLPAFDLSENGQDIRRIEHADWNASPLETNGAVEHGQPAAPISETEVIAPKGPITILSPSNLGGAKALPGAGMDTERALVYGSYVHAILDDAPAPDDLPADLATAAMAEATAVRQAHPDIFAPNVLSEVPMVAMLGTQPLHGIIDRLTITPEQIEVIDFKTNRVVPNTPGEVPDGILRQMGAYVHGLGQIYPGRKITASIIWTATTQRMIIPHEIVSAVMMDIPNLDGTAQPT